MGDIRNFFGRAYLQECTMGRGVMIVIEDKRLGDYPLADINIPFASQEKNRSVAQFLLDAWNSRGK